MGYVSTKQQTVDGVELVSYADRDEAIYRAFVGGMKRVDIAEKYKVAYPTVCRIIRDRSK